MGDPIENISPIDGRYNSRTSALVPFFSENALIKYRTFVEGEYLMFLLNNEQLPNERIFSDEEVKLVENISIDFTVEKGKEVKDFEKKTNHDVKAVEYFMKKELENTSLSDILEFIHFGLTSYDTNNICTALMVRDSFENVIIPKLIEVKKNIETLAEEYASTPMLARTHGQPASPTTFGKEMKVYSERLRKQIEKIQFSELEVKLNGASGNYNAHEAAYPGIDWMKFTEDFINILDTGRTITLKPNLVTTQIEPNDSLIELFDAVKRTNNILVDFNRDIWQYISDNWLVQKPKAGEIGSSTMPHKVNPIDFENSEGNLYLANGLFNVFGDRMQISRLQRDLSGSTIERNYGVALSHCLIAYDSVLKGLKKINVNSKQMEESLNQHPEVITEGIQTILRRDGKTKPYEQLLELTRGKTVTLEQIYEFVNTLDISENTKIEISKLTPSTYTGIASKIVYESGKRNQKE